MLMFTLGATNLPRAGSELPSPTTPPYTPPPPSVQKLLTAWTTNVFTDRTVSTAPVKPALDTQSPPIYVPPISTQPPTDDPRSAPQPQLTPSPSPQGQPGRPAGGIPGDTPTPMPPGGQVYPSGSSTSTVTTAPPIAPPNEGIPVPPDGMLPVDPMRRVPKWAWWALGVSLGGIGLGLILSR